MLAMLWNWNHKSLGIKERGVYLAVRILFRGKCCIGRPSPSWSSGGNVRLKYSFLGAAPLLVSPSSLLSFCGTSADWETSVPPDALFFSLAGVLFCNLPTNERRFMELLLTVNFRVAHRDLCVDNSPPAPSPPPPSGGAMLVRRRAAPDHPKTPARLARFLTWSPSRGHCNGARPVAGSRIRTVLEPIPVGKTQFESRPPLTSAASSARDRIDQTGGRMLNTGSERRQTGLSKAQLLAILGAGFVMWSGK